MSLTHYAKICLLPVLIFLSCLNSSAQVVSDAGLNRKICLGASTVIGGSPTASLGTSPYTYSWTPAFFLNNVTIANPTANPTVTTTYYVFVSDALGETSFDSVTVAIDSVAYFEAGSDTSICTGGSVKIGDKNNKIANGITYAWAPGGSLSSSTIPNPVASPLVTTVYTLVITSQSCSPKICYVTVTVFAPPLLDAGLDVTIAEGQSVSLHASGSCTAFLWGPSNTLQYFTTADPQASPTITTTYYVYGADANKGCYVLDSVTVFVVAEEEPVFYNTFTPNLDEDNDVWFIGNLGKFPDNVLEVYNRDGKLVFNAHKYQNNWDGTNFGANLPAATYYYIFYPGNDKKAYHGDVTIIR